MAPPQSLFARGMEGLGVARDAAIVFYDQQGSVGACRAWWTARLFGHDESYVLDGGAAAWIEAGGAVESGAPEIQALAAPYRPQARYALLAGAGDVLDALGDPERLVLDARSAARFAAEAPEPRPGVRGGHMPGAANLPFGELLDGSGRFLPREALLERFERAGWSGQDVITSCGSGLTAATLTVGLAAAGLPVGRLYDGSWAEWGADATLPVVP
jgi:thiosulfate/3-mercaptopyruvate sulfurtransferase